MNADGSYTYTRNADAPGGVTDTFTYTLTDTDGDADTAVLSISIGNSEVVVDVPTTGEAGTSVDEAALASGSNAGNDDDGETTMGTIGRTRRADR